MRMDTKLYDLGYGAKSTVKMKTISNNRFLLIHDEDVVHGSQEAGTSRKHDIDVSKLQGFSHEVVPETQPLPTSMAD